MTAWRYLLAVVVGTVVLVLWHGLAQLFPWGVASVSNFSATSEATYVVSSSELEQAPPGTWTTEMFDEQLGGRISTLATDQSFSWIISARREHYRLQKYFAFHALTQFCVANLLILVLCILAPLSRARRLAAVLCLSVTGTIAIYGGMLNWMGMPSVYGLGQSFNHVVGWFFAFLVIDRLSSSKPAPATQGIV